MKTTLSLTLTLLTFVMLAFAPNSFAQEETSPEYVVRVIYFVPSGQASQPDIDAKLDTLIRDVQQFYAKTMENHGFGRKTFRLETDTNGKVVVHHINGRFTAEYYVPHKIANEIEEQFGQKDQNVLICTEKSVGGVALGRMAFVRNSSYVPTAAHELGHTFGLGHDYRNMNNIKLIPTSYISDDVMLASFCTAEWLDVHPYFNTGQTTFNRDTNIQILSPTTSSPDAIRLRFKVNDPDGLHQAQLLATFQSGISKNSQLHVHREMGLIACKPINGRNTTVEFVTTRLTRGSTTVGLKVMDVHGNFTTQGFPIDIAHLLPSPEVVSVPDPNLAEALRARLVLAPTDPITQLDMLGLQSFYLITGKNYRIIGQNIMDFTGLEHATNLRILDLRAHPTRNIRALIRTIAGLTNLRELRLEINQISDISPLAELTGLTYLRKLRLNGNQISHITPLAILTNLHQLWLDFNQISDITPLEELTDLRELRLSGNQISNISSLAVLTNLNRLWLGFNQISDVSPLAGLINLKELHLAGNPIKDQGPLLALLRRNPDLKIDIDLDVSNNAPMFTNGSTTTRSLAEHTGAGVNIGRPVAATDADNESLTYTLSGTDAALFDIDLTTGQLKTRATLDYETKSSYIVTVTVSDGKLTDEITVTINVSNVNEAPVFTAGSNTTRTVAEHTGAGVNIGLPVAATDADNESLTYALSGTDAALFDIDSTTGQLKTRGGTRLRDQVILYCNGHGFRWEAHRRNHGYYQCQ